VTLTPFSFLNAINDSKQDLMLDPDAEKVYVPFVVNRTLSYFPDTVALANQMNIHHHADHKMQFHFLLKVIRQRKRFTKWSKPDQLSDIEVVKQYYDYSNEKARQVLKLISKDQMVAIRAAVDTGGR
jgi:hypothetical protein